MNTGTTRTVMLGLAALSVMAGCANESASRRVKTTEYQQAIDRAAASIQQAGQGTSAEAGTADLNRARDKLNEARKFGEAGNATMAERLALEAELDAEVALATGRNQEAQAAVGELQQSIQTLEDELRRNEARTTERL